MFNYLDFFNKKDELWLEFLVIETQINILLLIHSGVFHL